MGESLNFTGNNSQGTDKLGEHDLAVISAYVFIVGVLGFIGNLWVLIAFCCYKTLRTTTNLFIVHLAGCDLMLAVMDVAFSFPSTVKHRWLFGAVGCEAFGFVYHFLNAMSFNTLAIISLDRFWVITKPSFGAKITVKRALFCVVHVLKEENRAINHYVLEKLCNFFICLSYLEQSQLSVVKLTLDEMQCM